MNEYFLLLSKYIPLQEKPELSLPIVASVIGWWFLTKSIVFLQKDKYPQNLEITQQQLYQRLRRVHQQIIFMYSSINAFRFFIYCRFFVGANTEISGGGGKTSAGLPC